MKNLLLACMWFVVMPGVVAADSDADSRAVPNVIGKTADEANVLAKRAGFSYQVEVYEVEVGSSSDNCEDKPADVPVGHIACQSPRAGKMIDKDDRVMIVVRVPRKYIKAAELKSVIGLPVDQAKAKLADLGFVGQIEVKTLPTFEKDCGGLDRVCGTRPESGVSVHDHLDFYVNPKVTISSPPP